MANDIHEQSVTRLLTYYIASADMFYAEEGQRDIYVCDYPGKGFRIWGEIPGEGPSSAVDLCQIFLEVALTCKAMQDPDQVCHQMQSFGEDLGQALAEHIRDSSLLETLINPAESALTCLFESKHAQFSLEYTNHEFCLVVESCPIHDVSEHTGLRQVELAHSGFITMCRSLINALNLSLVMNIALEPFTGHIVSLTVDY